MFGSDDKKQSDSAPQANNPVGGIPMATPPESPLVTAPPDPVFIPTAPPLNDTVPDTPPQNMPTILPPASANVVKDTEMDKPSLDTELGSSDDAMLQTLNSTVASPAPTAPPAPASTSSSGDLINLKQQALQNLAPLVGKLEQTPQEKFKTTMMLIQASDNASLIKDAYDAASAITDEKARAQALLDVVNEINYFTQKQNPQKG